MDRASLARNMVEPAQAPIALGPNASSLQESVLKAANEAGVVLRFGTPPTAGARGTSAGARTLQETVSEAKKEVVGAVVLDIALLSNDPMKPESWHSAGSRLLDASRFAPNSHVLLIGQGSGWNTEAIRQNARRAVARASLLSTARSMRQTELVAKLGKGGPDIDQAIERELARPGVGENIRVVVGGDPEALRQALETSVSKGALTVRFKVDGETRTTAPLEAWLTAATQRLLGTTEFSTRLPGALLAWLSLLVLVLVSRRVFGDRVALIAGAVCMSLPLFYAQARSATGETGAMLGLTMIAGALLIHAHKRQHQPAGDTKVARNLWLLFAGGLLVGFLSKGLFALLTYAVIAVAFALIAGDRDRKLWKLSAVAVAAVGASALWVFNSPDHGFASMFGLDEAIFSKGPTEYARNFDLVIHQIGFGLFPWSPFIVLVSGGLIFSATKHHDRRLLVTALWFAIPLLLMMMTLKNFNQFLWPAAPAAALAIGLALERFWVARYTNHLMSLLLVAMFFILLSELKDSPQPLAGFLTFDPPFAKKGALRFPESLELASAMKLSGYAMLLVTMIYLSRCVEITKRIMQFLRGDLPFWITTTAVAGVFAFGGLLLRIVLKYGSINPQDGAALAPHQRGFANALLASTDPIVLTTGVLCIVFVVVYLFRWLPGWARRLWGASADTAYAPSLLTGLSNPDSPLQSVALRVASGAWLLLGLAMMFSVQTPSDYYGEILGGGSLAVVVLGAVAGFSWARAVLGESTQNAAALALGIVGLFLGANYMRDAWHFPWYATALSLTGAIAFGIAVLPSSWRDGTSFCRALVLPATVFGVAVALPLIARYDMMLPIIQPGTDETQASYILKESRLTALMGGALLLLLANRYLIARLFDGNWGKKVAQASGNFGLMLAQLQRGSTAVPLLVALGLVASGGAIASFYPSLAQNVSQKHIIDTYRAAEELDGNETGHRIFKHGAFGSATRGDANFYTASIPEIRDRTTALKVLLGQQDMAVQVETSGGTRVVPIQGWLHDASQTRSTGGIVGVASEVGPGTLTDKTATWKADAHKGKVLVDSTGKTFNITGNTATTLSLDGAKSPRFSAIRRQDAFYAIDDPKAANHRATAKAAARYYFLLPADNFSGINHAFRKLSKGRHIPVIDGRSYRVLLASSWLGPDETNANRYALHTMSRQEFDALSKPGMMKAKPGSYLTNFDDKIWIVGFSTSTPLVSKRDEFEVTVYYQSIKPVTTSQKVFMHIDKRGTSNRIHSDHWPLNLTAGGEDDKACTGCYRTDHWLPGDVIVDTYRKKVPSGNPSGIHDVWTGLYRPAGGARMKVKDWDRDQISHDGGNRVRLGNFVVR